jgi:hypothetical protein
MLVIICGIVGTGLLAGLFSVGVVFTLVVLAFLLFVVMCLLLEGEIPDPKIVESGRIHGELQALVNERVNVLWKIRSGAASWEDYERLQAREAAFRETIEIDLTDGRCIYRRRTPTPSALTGTSPKFEEHEFRGGEKAVSDV